MCEYEESYLKCPDQKQIHIISATYGRTDLSICQSPDDIDRTDCSSDAPLHIVEANCNGKEYCKVQANNGLYGDPCVHTYKYLTVKFECKGKSYFCIK